MESRIIQIVGRALVLRGNDIDTDRILPARFLKAITFEGLEAHLFEDDRRQMSARGETHPFDDESRADAAILIVSANFGCGSSREHAPQAIRRRGIRAVVGESFAEIFFANALAIGLPCVSVPSQSVNELMALAETSPQTEFTIDLQERHIATGSTIVTVTLPDSARHALLSGTWDATGLLLEHDEDIERTAAKLPYLRRFEP